MITYKAEIDIKVFNNKVLDTNGTWDRENQIKPAPNKTIVAARRYFRVGTAEVRTIVV